MKKLQNIVKQYKYHDDKEHHKTDDMYDPLLLGRNGFASNDFYEQKYKSATVDSR